jgi:hypothetical protein
MSPKCFIFGNYKVLKRLISKSVFKSWLLFMKGILILALLEPSLAQTPTAATISLASLTCSSASSLGLGDRCKFEITIGFPVNTPTTLLVQLNTAENTSLVYAQLCRPVITIGSNYNLSTAPAPVMVANLSPSQVSNT